MTQILCLCIDVLSMQALKVLGLGKLHDPKETIVDMATTLIQKGIAKPQKV